VINSSFDTQLVFISQRLAGGRAFKGAVRPGNYFNSRSPATRCHRRPRKAFHFGICSMAYALGHATASWMFKTSVRISLRIERQVPPIIFSDRDLHLSRYLYNHQWYRLLSTQTVGSHRGITSRGFREHEKCRLLAVLQSQGWFRVGDQLYYSYGSTYCSVAPARRGPGIWQHRLWASRQMTYVGNCE